MSPGMPGLIIKPAVAACIGVVADDPDAGGGFKRDLVNSNCWELCEDTDPVPRLLSPIILPWTLERILS